MGSFLPEIVFCVDKVLVHYEVNVGVVGVEELLNLTSLRVINEQAKMLQQV